MLNRPPEKLDHGISWELKREVVEVLVDGIAVDTVGTGKQRETVINEGHRLG